MDLLDEIQRRLISESAKYANSESVKCDTRRYECKVNGCLRNGYANGYCNAHYIRKRNGADMTSPIRNRKANGKCSLCGIDCNTKGGCGMCAKHYRSIRVKIIKEVIVDYFGGKCARCGDKFPNVCFDLHHIDPLCKELSVASMLNKSSIASIADEAKKCELICANCHRIHHFQNQNYELQSSS